MVGSSQWSFQWMGLASLLGLGMIQSGDPHCAFLEFFAP